MNCIAQPHDRTLRGTDEFFGTVSRPRRGAGADWLPGLFLIGLLIGGAPAAGAAPVQYLGHAGAHNLYVLNEDGNLFRWGEPRYGQYASSRAAIVVPYFEAPQAVPPSPTGARWAGAAGHLANELFRDEAGRVFASQIDVARPTQLVEIVHPDGVRKWFKIGCGGYEGTLVDDAGFVYELSISTQFSWMRGNPGSPVPTPNPWLKLVGRPGTYESVIDLESRPGFELVRTTGGELFGRGYSPWGLAGSIAVPGTVWNRVERPAGVARWTAFKASNLAAIALADSGEAYYWGLRIAGSEAASPEADYRIPALLDRPVGVSRWKSVAVAGSLVLLVSQEGGLFAFGVEADELMSPFQAGSSPLTAATRAIHPALQGSFDFVQGGADYVVARGSDGVDFRWGSFMQLENVWQPGAVGVEPFPLSERITTLPKRLAPEARSLAPAPYGQVPLGEAFNLSAEVFALNGPLASTRFVLDGNPLPGLAQVNGNLATLSWTATAPGEHGVQVLATDAAGRTNRSAVVPFSTRHAVRWAVSTNRISELPGGGLATSAEVLITRTELPYPNYHSFTYRFRIWPLPLLGKDFTIDGATLLADDSAYWEVRFAPGQKTATVRITALEDVFTEPDLYVHFEPAHDWAKEQDFLNPAEPLVLVIEDSTPIGGPSPVYIIDRVETRFSFLGGTVPVAVSVPKSLVELPVVQLLTSPEMYLPHFLDSIEDLPDRRVYHFTLHQLPAGLHELTARVRDGTDFGYDRYVDSLPLPARVWDTAGLPQIRVVAAEQVVNERDEPIISLTVMRDGPLTAPGDVGLEIRGTALGGSDYEALPATVTIPAGASYTQVILRIHDDTHAELDEAIYISARQHPCEQLEGCAVADRGSVLRVSIRDDDREAPVSGGARVAASPYSDASYLVTASGQLYAWGDNQNGRLGLGDLPPELAEAVPWPRLLRGLTGADRWERLLVGSSQAFGVTTHGGLYAWGSGFPDYNQSFSVPIPRPVLSLPSDAEPFYVWNGSLITRLTTGRLWTFRVTSYQPHQMQAAGAEGMAALLVTPQLQVLSDEGYFHDAQDWQGLYADRYPLAPGAGYWKDTASCGDQRIALDELGSLFRVLGGAVQFDPETGRTRRFYTTEPVPGLPGDRTVAQLFGNDLGIVALATDGTAFTLEPGTNGVPAVVIRAIAFPAGVTRWTSLAAGRNHFLAVGDDGRVYGWGANAAGQLGDGTTDAAELPRALPVFANVNDPAVEFPTLDLARPPVASFYAMEASYHLGGPDTIRVSARAFDPDGLIERVEFLIDGEVAAVAAFDLGLRAFVADVFVPRPGDLVLTARAWDNSGLSGDSEGIPVRVEDPALYPVVKVWNIPSGTAEGYGFPGYFVISRQGIADVPLTVYFDLHGTATEGGDFPALPRSVVIPAGAAEVRLPVIARPDFVDEDTEEVNLTILNPGCDPDTAAPGSGCYRIGEPATAPVFIIDYLRPGSALLPFISMRLVNSPIVRESTTNRAVIEVRRNGVSIEDLSVHYELGGTAENGVDYEALSGVVVIPAGAETATFTVSAIEDFVPEPYEHVVVTLVNPGCATEEGAAAGCYVSDAANSLTIIVGDKPVLPPLPNSVPRPVLFDGIVFFEGEGTLLNVVSDPGVEFVFEVSADLVNWQPLGRVTSDTGRVEFFDVDAANARSRFYRLVPPPNP